MKKLFLLVIVCGGLMSAGGCSTPAYTMNERGQLIARNWNYEGAQMADDIDNQLLLRPVSKLTIWNVR